MGAFKVKALLWSPHNIEKKASIELLVDIGSTYTVIPATLLKSLGIIGVLRTVKLRLADNRVIEKPLGEIGIEIDGYRVSATPVVFGEENVYLLGSVTMEQLGLAPDPIEKRLKPVEALLMNLKRNNNL
ncbi:MAG: Retroviral aspartyl protease [Candidatus Bathyarchaeia archaeon]